MPAYSGPDVKRRAVSRFGLVALAAASTLAWARPPSALILAPPTMTFRAPPLAGAAALRIPGTTIRGWRFERPLIAWPEEQRKLTPVSLPTMLPTARGPLRWDATPQVPCPAGERRLWQSFGSMPAADLMIAGWSGYRPSSLCAPVLGLAAGR